MTGYSRTTSTANGVTVNCEIKSLNGRFLEINCRLPKNHSHHEIEVRDTVRKEISRGNVSVNISIDFDESVKPFVLNTEAALEFYKKLSELNKKLKIKEPVSLQNLMYFSNNFYRKDEDDNEDLQWKLVKKVLADSLKNIQKMKKAEGQLISKDLFDRMKVIKQNVEKIESLGMERIPEERERYRTRIAQLFENEEIDEHRLAMEIIIMADKLDISEECVRLNSHLNFYFEALKSKDSEGRKINFLLQEMNREINTIGSKANDAVISQIVVHVKEELERIREQIQNIE